MNWIDAHCHLSDPRLAPHLGAVLERSRKVGITRFIQGGVDPDDWDRQIKLNIQYHSEILTSFGLHPWWVARANSEQIEYALERLPSYLKRGVALGELGLDFHPKFVSPDSFERQRTVFRRQLAMANAEKKPLVLHIVRAHSEAIQMLKEFLPLPRGGIVHSFSGSLEIAKDYLSMGLLISYGGSLTRMGKKGLEAALSIPPENVVLESDAPDQTPEFAKGLPFNEPSTILGLADYLASHRGVKREEILEKCTSNLKRVFKELE